jgi:flagellar assembly protein FliH
MNMLAKVIKDHEVGDHAAYLFPEIGVGTSGLTRGVTAFVVPDLDDFQFDAGISPASQNAAGAIALMDPTAASAQASAEETAQALQRIKDQALAEAQEVYLADVAEMRKQLADSLQSVSRLGADIATRVESEVVELALQIARKIIGREVTVDREIALTLVRSSLAKLHNRSIAVVHLNPDDFAFVEAGRETLGFRGSLELVEDNSISAGGCLVHTDTGDIDAQIDSQFDEIAHGLFS